MADRAQLEDALVAAHNAGDTEAANIIANEIKSLSSQPIIAPKVEVTPQVPLSQRLGRQAGLTARYGLEGLGSIVDLAQAPVRGAMNLALPENRQLQPVSAGGSIADLLGLPQPQTGTERVVGDISRTMAGTGGVIKAAGAVSPTSAVGQGIRESLAGNVPTQLAGSIGAGGAGGLTREAGGGETSQFLASLLGGVGAGSLVKPKPTGLSVEQIQNAPKDKLLNTAQKAGYIALPSDVGAGKFPKALETISGKYKSEELASSKNQDISNSLTRKYLGLQESTPLNTETLDTLRDLQSPAYEAIRNTGTINLGNKNPFAKFVGGIKEAPGGRNQLLGEVKTNYSIDANDAVEQIKQLRSDGNDYYRSGTDIQKPNPKLKALGQKYISEANKLEGILESHVNKIGQPDLVQNFRNARKEIAKTYTVEKALLGENLIDYRKIGKMIGKKEPITDELALAGKFAKEFERVNKPIAYQPTAFTLPDVFASGIGAGVDLITGVPLASAIPAARVGSRYLMESAPFQQRFVQPKYNQPTTPFVPYMGLLNEEQ